MTTQFQDIADLVLATHSSMIKRGAFTDLQTDLTEHVAVNEMWKNKSRKFPSGDEYEFFLQIDHNHTAKQVGLFETDTSIVSDSLISGKVPQRHTNAHYLFDLREKAMQGGDAAKMVDVVESRYMGMMSSFYEHLEEQCWGTPASSADNETIMGISFWLQRAATEGFNGVDPTGFAEGRAGISSATYPRWANNTGQYVEISKADLLTKMRNAQRKTAFRSPLSHANPTISDMGNGIYTNIDVINTLEELLEAQNMNLGNDLASKMGMTTFKSTPVQYVPYLDADTGDPVYMIDWKYMGMVTLEGWENNQTAPYKVANMHNVMRVDLDATMNMVCTDLRRQTVLYK